MLCAALLALLVPATASAAFTDCDILSGQPVSCANGFEGVAVVLDRELFRECTFKEGEATACGKPFDGRALVQHEGIYQMCDLAEGQVYRCVAWAQGRAPQWAPEADRPQPDLTDATRAAKLKSLASAKPDKAPTQKKAKSPAAGRSAKPRDGASS